MHTKPKWMTILPFYPQIGPAYVISLGVALVGFFVAVISAVAGRWLDVPMALFMATPFLFLLYLLWHTYRDGGNTD